MFKNRKSMFEDKIQRFSIRKLTVGVVSGCIAAFLIGMSTNNQVHADTIPATQETAITTTSQKDASTAAPQTVGQAQADVSQKQAALDTAQKDLTAGQKQNAAIDQAKKDVTSETNKITETQKGLDQSKQNLATEQNKTAGLNEANQKAQEAASQAQADKANAQKANDDAQAKLDSLKDQNKAAAKAQDKLDQAQQAQEANKQAQAKDAQDLVKAAEDANKAATDYNNALDAKTQADTALTHAQNDLKTAQDKASELQAKAKAAAENQAKLATALNTAKQALANKQAAMNQNQDLLNKATSAKTQADSDVATYQAQVDDLTKQIQAGQTAQDVLAKQIADNAKLIQTLTDKQSTLQAQLTKAQADFDVAQKAVINAMAQDANMPKISQEWVSNVNHLQHLLDDDKTPVEGHTQPDGSYLVTSAPPTENWHEAHDQDWIATRHAMSELELAMNNKFTSNPDDTKKTIDVNNVSAADDLELNIFAVKMINAARSALGKKLLTLNQSAIDMAREIGQEYNKDGRTNPDALGHDPKAINTVSKAWGIDHFDDFTDTTTAEPGDPWTMVHDYQMIENLGPLTLITSNTYVKTNPADGCTYIWDDNMENAGTGDRELGTTTMNVAKRNIWASIIGMLFANNELGHMRSLTSTLGDAPVNNADTIYTGIGFNAPKGKDGSVHILIIPSTLVLQDSKFDKNANIAIPDTADLGSKANQLSAAKSSLEDQLAKATSDLTAAQNTQTQLNGQKTAEANKEATNTQLKSEAQSKLDDAKARQTQAAGDIEKYNKVATTLNSDYQVLQDNETQAQANADKGQAALNKANLDSTIASSDVIAKQNAVTTATTATQTANKNLNGAKITKDKKAQAQADLQSKLDELKGNDAALQDAVDKATQGVVSYAEIVKVIKQAQDDYKTKNTALKASITKADATLSAAQTSQKAVDDNAKSISNLQKDIVDKSNALTQAKKDLAAAQKTSAMTPVDLKGLKAKVDAAQSALNTAQANLNKLEAIAAAEEAAAQAQANAQKAANSQETPMSGVAYVPVINGNKNWKVALHDASGRMTGEYINTNSGWKVFAKKTINGQLMYRLGTEDQWIPAQFANINDMDEQSSEETSINDTVYVPVVNGNKNWKVALRDSEGRLTGQYISTNSNWKVVAKKTVNGEVMYRLGTEDQWIPAQYALTSAETPIKAVVYIPVINNNRNWKVALRNSKGQMTGKFIQTNSNWMALAKKTVNGEVMYRLGNQDQWVPAKYINL